MAAIIHKDALDAMADYVVSLEPFNLRLSRLPVFPDWGASSGPLGVAESYFDGYVAALLDNGVVTFDLVTHLYTVTYPLVSFTKTVGAEAQDVYGYWIHKFADPGNLVNIFAWPGPLPMTTEGQQIHVTPVITLGQFSLVT